MPADFQTDVLIIGAGITGLTLSYRLRQKSIACLLLEERKHVGGRLAHAKTRSACELGAEFIHGSHRAITALVKEANLEMDDYPMDGGEGRFFCIGERIYNQSSAFAKQVEHLYELLHTHRGYDVSVDQFARKVGVSEDGAGFFARARVARLEGASLADLSASSLQSAITNAGNADRNARIKGGFIKLINWLSPNCTLLLGTKVTRIFWSEDRVCVQTADGSRLTCAKLVLTVPLDILQASLQMFKPLLPHRSSKAISSLRMGVAAKIVIHVKRVSWINFSAFATDGPVEVWWNYRHDHGNALVGFTAGPGTAKFEKCSMAELSDQAITDIRRIGGQLSRSDIINVESVVWNRLGRMAYSYVPVHALGCRSILAEPIGDRIYIAGEATVPAGLAGTIAGAVESADRVAAAISRDFETRLSVFSE